jgi:CBS domain-containing protein
MSISNLHDSLIKLRNTPVSGFIEPGLIAKASDSVSDVIGVLLNKSYYDIFIPLSDKIAVVNIRDILGIRNVTSTNIATLGRIIPALNSKSTLADAARLMSLYRLRTVPFVEKNVIKGQISAKKIVKEIRDIMLVTSNKKISASDVMTPNPIVIGISDKIASAKTIMKRKRIDHLPVLQDNRLVGIITSKDIMELILEPERIGRKALGIDSTRERLDISINGILDKNVLTSQIDDSFLSVTDLMVSQDSTYCVIKGIDEVQGIITYRDIINMLGEKVEEEIPIFLIGLPDDPLDAELAKSKFTNLAKLLKKAYPDIEQARCRIKIREVKGARKRYEVDANLISTRSITNYVTVGWDLPKIFDEISDSLKKRLAHKRNRRQIESRYANRSVA